MSVENSNETPPTLNWKSPVRIPESSLKEIIGGEKGNVIEGDNFKAYCIYGDKLSNLDRIYLEGIANRIASLTGGRFLDGTKPDYHEILPNLLPQDAQTILDQISNGLAIISFVPDPNNPEFYIPKNFATLYRYENVENMFELGTVATLYGQYSGDRKNQKSSHKGLAQAMYDSIVKFANEEGIGIVATTTAKATLFLGSRAGFKFITRENLMEIFPSWESILRDICICPAEKTGSEDNTHCMCANVHEEILKGKPVNNGHNPCAIRVYIPPNHSLRRWFEALPNTMSAEKYVQLYPRQYVEP